MKNTSQLTFTRFVAAMMVVLFHFAVDKVNNIGFINLGYILSVSNNFVSYFFFLSGFVLTLSQRHTVLHGYLIDRNRFYINRLARLYPVYILALLFTCILMYFVTKESVKLWSVMASVFFLQAWIPDRHAELNFPAWSLSCEVFFYALFPFMIRLFLKFGASMLLVIGILIYVLWNGVHAYMIYFGDHNQLFYENGWFHYVTFKYPIMHLGVFALGMIAGIYWLRNESKLSVYNKIWPWAAIVAIGLWLIVAINRPWWLYYHHNGLFTPLYVLLVYGLSLSQNKIISILQKPFFIWLGEISYTIYLLQVPLYIFLRSESIANFRILGYSIGLLPNYLVILVIVSGLVHEFVEKPVKAKIQLLAPTKSKLIQPASL